MQLEIKFEGSIADDHMIPAFEGTQSLEGIGRALTLISHYVVTGHVRYKSPFSDDFRLLIESFEPGSFKTRIRALYNPPAIMAATAVMVGQPLVSGPVGNFAYDAIKFVWNEALGKRAQPETAILKQAIESKGGDFEALSQAITPSLKRAHTIIGNGANSINVVGDGNQITVLNERTKDYLEKSTLDHEIHEKELSVASLNVNSGYGRVYDFEFEHTLPFVIDGASEPRTAGNLGRSLSIYANKLNINRFHNAKIHVKFQIFRDIEGNPLKYRILDCWFDGE